MGDLRQRLKAAVDATLVPPGLETRILARIRTRQRPRAPLFAVAGVVACALLAVVYVKGYLPVAYGPQASYIASVSRSLPDLIKVGLGDHIHCAVFRTYAKTPPAETLGANYAGLAAIVQSHIPTGYRMMLAHQCHYLGRKFIHIVVGDGQHLASLVITSKGENEILRDSEAGAAPFQISAFEGGSYLVYFISDLPAARNAELLARMATQVKAVLRATES